ncbi:amino acid ABC transporter ATP-binding/permease protein [Aliidiomarina celeris]|uniref:amino acid ABC transporter ATP-binding/permease protein n=1 Tax=Aliidiomarina celeris TaxID=2249428 RepID=UPI000DE9611E|nr:ATP-binding cassette domain-containing protein [Aliidiomarina celeris]
MKLSLLSHAFWQPLRPWLAELWRLRRGASVGLICALVAALAGIGLLALSGWFITSSAFAGVLAFGLVFNIYTPGAGVRLFALLRTVGRYFERLFQHDFILSLQSHWRVLLFRGLVNLPFEQQASAHTGTQVQRLMQDLKVLENLWLGWLSPTAVALVSVVFVALLSAFWSGVIALLVLVFGILVGALLLRLAANTGAQQAHVSQAEEQLQRNTLDMVNALAELSAWGLTPHYIEQTLTKREVQTQSKIAVRDQANRCLAQLHVLHGILVLSVAGFAACFYQQGQLTGPVAVLLSIAVLALSEVLNALPTQFALAGKIQASAKALAQLTRTEQQSEALPSVLGDIEFVQQNGKLSAIQFHHFAVQQGQRMLLQPVSCTIHGQQQVTLCAASGAGKSSLANALVGAARRQGIAVHYLTQQNYLFNGTVWQNLTLVRPMLTEDEAWQVLDMCDLKTWLSNSADGLHTEIGENADKISGGQARRLALARILLMDPELLVLDEPFTGVDEATRSKVLNRIGPWLRGRTCLFIGHQQDVLPPAHVHYLLYEQRLHTLPQIHG